ncbi:MAG: threonine/serine dehydratase [Thermoanaerobaculia bacterium]
MNIATSDIQHAARTIAPYVRVTPVLTVRPEDFGLSGFELQLKLELLQHSGSFKARGAFASLLLRDVPPAGVVAASGGNHGAAVAYAARRLGIPAKIFVYNACAPAKVARIRGYGAELVIGGDRYTEALAASEAWADESGAMRIHAFDQRETLLGQGTIGAELSTQTPDIDTLLVAVGGGGLIAGIASWYRGAVKIVGVEPETAPTLTAALQAGTPVDAPAGGVAADSLAPQRVGELVFPIVREHVNEVVLVADDDIVRAQQSLWDVARIAAEPGGAAAFAALLSGGYQPRAGERVAVLLCGANTDAVRFT